MSKEQERKFLVDELNLGRFGFKQQNGILINQGYLSQNIRVRIVSDKYAFITLKYPTKSYDIRDEFEYTIPITDAMQLMARCTCGLTKYRYSLNDFDSKLARVANNYEIIVDYFPTLDNWLGEVEYKGPLPTAPNTTNIWEQFETLLQTKAVPFTKEVTDDKRYTNYSLAVRITEKLQGS